MADERAQRDVRVVMVLTQFMPEVFGGAEQQCLRLSRQLLDRGVRPHILSSRSDTETPSEEIMQGVPVTRLFCPVPPQRGGRHLLSSIRWMSSVSRWLTQRQKDFDIIHCHQAKFNAWVGTKVARKLGKPSIVKPGSAGPNFDLLSLERKRFIYGKLAAQSVAKHASTFVAISSEMMLDLQVYGIDEERRILIPNGVSLCNANLEAKEKKAKALRRRIGANGPERIALFAGRMETQKNVETLLQAFSQLVRTGVPGQLVLLGNGSLHGKLKALSKNLGIEGRAHFIGRVDNVPDYMAAADLFVLPALAEGMSNAVLEAMAEGTPQIVSKVSGNADLVEHGKTGWLYGTPRDTNALTSALREGLTCSPKTLHAMSLATASRAREAFSIETTADRYRALYDYLLK